MKRFTRLYMELDATTRTSEKIAAIKRYFAAAAPLDAAWAVFLLSGRKLGKTVSSRRLRAWAAEVAGLPDWLLEECYHVVGDLSETLSLLIAGEGSDAPPLHDVAMHFIQPLSVIPQTAQRELILQVWRRLNADQRLVFHKLLGGNFRVGVSKQLLTNALAESAGVEAAVMAQRLAGPWKPNPGTMARLMAPPGTVQDTEGNLPYPFMLAHPLLRAATDLGNISDWLLEWKWDGIRAQIIRRHGQAVLWSRGEELIAQAFPEIAQAAQSLPEGTVLDGEILAWDEAHKRPEPFQQLQRRVNRRSVQPGFWPETPVVFMAFDLLEHAGKDVRQETLAQRRGYLKTLVEQAQEPRIKMSQTVVADTWAALQEAMLQSRARGVEGIMLKRRTSPYHPGRVTGLWWKWKVAPYTLDVVLIAAEPGHGKRAGLLTDYTFGLWQDGALVPIAKAYSGLTNDEIAELDRFIRAHTLARHGPVHVVEPLRVFEIAFEAIQESRRHKAGIAVRFPRILRIRSDKAPADADRVETAGALLRSHAAERVNRV